MATALEYIFATNLLFMASSLLGYDLGVCLALISLSKDVKNDVHGLNQSTRVKDDRPKISQRFSKLIQIYSDAKQLSD